MAFLCYVNLRYLIVPWLVLCRVTQSTDDEQAAWNFLETFDCGESAADRIIGGYNASLGQFPWIARLGYTTQYDDTVEWLCGGSLISDRHVLTAAHCLHTASDDSGFDLKYVRLGELNTLTDPDCQLGVCAPKVQDIAISKIIKHPDFKPSHFHNDLALLVLATPAQLHDYVAPVCLPRGNQINDIKLGDLMTVAGWGKMNMTTQERATVLQYVQIPLISSNICSTLSRGFKMTPGELCAGAQRNKDACGGDSGGPIMKVLDTPDGPKYYMFGVVSFGPTVCGIKKPGVYTSIPYFQKWILNNLIN